MVSEKQLKCSRLEARRRAARMGAVRYGYAIIDARNVWTLLEHYFMPDNTEVGYYCEQRGVLRKFVAGPLRYTQRQLDHIEFHRLEGAALKARVTDG